MILSDKFEITEIGREIVLKEKKFSENRETKEITEKWVLIGHYSKSATGRKQAYNAVIHAGISDLEVQSLEKIIDLIETANTQIEEFFGGE